MSDETSSSPHQTEPETESTPVAPKKRRPKFLFALTAIWLSLAILGRVFVSELDDAFSIGLDIVNVFTMFGLAFLIVVWTLWVLALSRWPWRGRLFGAAALIAVPILFFMLFRPVGGGDVNFLRFEPVWTSRVRPEPLKQQATDGVVDLKTETSDDFPRFLNSDTSTAVDATIDADAFSQSRIVWKQPIGLGWSGFVARNGFAVTMEQRAENECVSCYRIDTGELQWIYKHPARHRDSMNLGHVGPRSTPTLDDGNVYAVGALGNFVCLDGSSGEPIWRVDLNELLGITLSTAKDVDGSTIAFESNTSLAWGRSGSPLIVDDLVVVTGGGPVGENRSTLLAFDRQTGELRWRGGDEMIAYGSPTIASLAGKRQILLTAETQTMGFDPATGDVLWRMPRPGQSDGAANTSQVTVVSDNDVLVTKGYPDGGGELIRLRPSDNGIEPQSVWSNGRVMRTKLTSPLVYEGYAYCISNGFMECVDLSDGQRVWKRRGRFGHGQILRVGDKILVHSETGTLHLIDAVSDEYREYGAIDTIDGICWNNLCLYGSMLLVRSDLEAACVELPISPVAR
ncbi:MAG: PQQ-binding-like beta-propeller repeat protein [Pirellulaceae bacterium]